VTIGSLIWGVGVKPQGGVIDYATLEVAHTENEKRKMVLCALVFRNTVFLISQNGDRWGIGKTNKNLANANRSRVSCAHNSSRTRGHLRDLQSTLRITQVRNHWTDHTRLTIRRVIWLWILSWPWNVGQTQRSLKVIEISAIWKLGSYSPSIVTMAVSVAVCEIFSVKEWRDLENQVRDRSRSFKMAPFDRPYAIFYWSTIVNIALSCTILKLFDVE